MWFLTAFCNILLLLCSLIVAGSPSARSGALSQSPLAVDALAEILKRGAPILGSDEGCSLQSKTCDWMARIPDHTKLVHMNLPGTHDTSTWNYSDATQAALVRYTGLIFPAEIYRCQEHSIFQSLNEGIRVFDLRFAYNPGNDTIGFYHSNALLSPTTTLEDVLFGLYSWLDKHPTEAVLVSMNHESGTGTQNDVALQEHVYNVLSSDLARRYWVQTNGTLGTLRQARGKLTLLQRFNYDLLPSTLTKRIGIHLDPGHWTDNGPAITLVYNAPENQIAYIEDYYHIGLPLGAGAAANIQWKYNATIAHIENATRFNPDQLYISFASSEHDEDIPPEPPIVMALGNGTDLPGVNQKLLPWLQERKGMRFGIVMLDFYNVVPGLVEAVIGL